MGKGDNMMREVSGHEIKNCASEFSGFVLLKNGTIHRSHAWKIVDIAENIFCIKSTKVP